MWGIGLAGILVLTGFFLSGLAASVHISGFFGWWLKFRLFLAAVAHETGGPGGVGPGEDLTIEVPDDFNHVAGLLFVFCVFCKILFLVTKLTVHPESTVERSHNGTQIFWLLHL